MDQRQGDREIVSDDTISSRRLQQQAEKNPQRIDQGTGTYPARPKEFRLSRPRHSGQFETSVSFPQQLNENELSQMPGYDLHIKHAAKNDHRLFATRHRNIIDLREFYESGGYYTFGVKNLLNNDEKPYNASRECCHWGCTALRETRCPACYGEFCLRHSCDRFAAAAKNKKAIDRLSKAGRETLEDRIACCIEATKTRLACVCVVAHPKEALLGNHRYTAIPIHLEPGSVQNNPPGWRSCPPASCAVSAAYMSEMTDRTVCSNPGFRHTIEHLLRSDGEYFPVHLLRPHCLMAGTDPSDGVPRAEFISRDKVPILMRNILDHWIKTGEYPDCVISSTDILDSHLGMSEPIVMPSQGIPSFKDYLTASVYAQTLLRDATFEEEYESSRSLVARTIRDQSGEEPAMARDSSTATMSRAEMRAMFEESIEGSYPASETEALFTEVREAYGDESDLAEYGTPEYLDTLD